MEKALTMERLDIENPYGAPVYYREEVSSTMDVSRALASSGSPHGTVIMADFQSVGRGRQGRAWLMDRGKNLSATVMLRYESIARIPSALSLRAGLAVSFAVEDFAPRLKGFVRVKWPNDIMLLGAGGDAKTAGLLCEADGGAVHIGIGVNIAQKAFPPGLIAKAGSIALALEEKNAALPPLPPAALLALILRRLYSGLEGPFRKERLESRLYRRNEEVVFMDGPPDSAKEVRGVLSGVGEGGKILILPAGEKKPRPFITGELKVYDS